MADETPPLSHLARSAIDAELRRPAADDAMQARVLARLAGTIAVGAGIGAAAGTTAAATATATKGAAVGAAAGTTAVGAAATGAAGAGAAVGTAGAGAAIGLTAKTIPWIVLAFAAGGGTGAVIESRVAMKAPAPVVAPAPSETETRASPPAPRDPVPPPTFSPSSSAPEPTRPPPPPPPTRTAAPSAGPDVDLASERALIERARMALARGQSAAALEAVDAHAKAYPRGRLAEEREAIAIQALVQGGRAQDARARADRFRAAYPNSVFGAAVDAVVPPK